jgi:predicted flap endonuclease-1-like 5' DNA nuclease
MQSDLPEIGNPATVALAAAGIFNLADVANWSEAELQVLHSVGPKALTILKESLN